MASSEEQDATFREFVAYPFSQDETFTSGLNDLAAKSEEGSLPEELVAKAKAFYFSRVTQKTVDWTQFLQWQAKLGQPQPSVETVVTATQVQSQSVLDNEPLTFQRIVEVIESGQAHLLPNNEIVPDKLNPEQPSVSTQAVRKKPWE